MLELETSPGEGLTFRVTLPCRYAVTPLRRYAVTATAELSSKM
jgi:hypothetical protein